MRLATLFLPTLNLSGLGGGWIWNDLEVAVEGAVGKSYN
jgi:hypothetical protein